MQQPNASKKGKYNKYISNYWHHSGYVAKTTAKLKLQARNTVHYHFSQLIYDESTASDVSSILDDVDNYLAEVSDEDNSTGPTPPKQGRHVSPVSYQKISKVRLKYRCFFLANIGKAFQLIQLQKLLSKRQHA